MNIKEKLAKKEYIFKLLKKYDPYLEDITDESQFDINYTKDYSSGVNVSEDFTVVGRTKQEVPHFFALNYVECEDEEYPKNMLPLDAQNLYLDAIIEDIQECTCFSVFICKVANSQQKEYVLNDIYSSAWQLPYFGQGLLDLDGQKLPAKGLCLFFPDEETALREL